MKKNLSQRQPHVSLIARALVRKFAGVVRTRQRIRVEFDGVVLVNES